jgi:hypothetical protein
MSLGSLDVSGIRSLLISAPLRAEIILERGVYRRVRSANQVGQFFRGARGRIANLSFGRLELFRQSAELIQAIHGYIRVRTRLLNAILRVIWAESRPYRAPQHDGPVLPLLQKLSKNARLPLLLRYQTLV